MASSRALSPAGRDPSLSGQLVLGWRTGDLPGPLGIKILRLSLSGPDRSTWGGFDSLQNTGALTGQSDGFLRYGSVLSVIVNK